MIYSSLQDFITSSNLQKNNLLFILRHSQTLSNEKQIFQGQNNTFLSPKGLEQSKNLSLLFKDIKITNIFTSNLRRTIQTAELIAKHNNINIELKDSLNERKLGMLEGHTINTKDKNLKILYQELLKNPVDANLPDIENLKMIDKRIRSTLEDIIKTLEIGNTMIIGHKYINKIIVKQLLNIDFQNIISLNQNHNEFYIFEPINK